MTSSRASLTRDAFTPLAAGRTGQREGAAKGPSSAFDREIAAAAQVFADGLVEMWSARPGSGASDKRTLIASITDRADVLALRATAAAARPGTAASFGQAAMMIRDLAARRLSGSPMNASGSAS